jgi:hypothetical protein
VENIKVNINILVVTDETVRPIGVKFKGRTISGTIARLSPMLKTNISKKSSCFAGNNIFTIA